MRGIGGQSNYKQCPTYITTNKNSWEEKKSLNLINHIYIFFSLLQGYCLISADQMTNYGVDDGKSIAWGLDGWVNPIFFFFFKYKRGALLYCKWAWIWSKRRSIELTCSIFRMTSWKFKSAWIKNITIKEDCMHYVFLMLLLLRMTIHTFIHACI